MSQVNLWVRGGVRETGTETLEPTLLEPWWNIAGTWLEPRFMQPCPNLALILPHYNLALPSLGPCCHLHLLGSCWNLLLENLLLEPLAGTVLTLAGVFFSLLGFAWELTYENKF